jgi:hypothetical protein
MYLQQEINIKTCLNNQLFAVFRIHDFFERIKSFFKDKKSIRSHKTVGIKVFQKSQRSHKMVGIKVFLTIFA